MACCNQSGQAAGRWECHGGFPLPQHRRRSYVRWEIKNGVMMFKFLFSKAGVKPAETQRETIERALGEVNAVLALMADKAKVSVDLNSGLIEVDLPEQMPDEALALPAPTAEEVEEKAEIASEEAAPEEKAAA